jgi:hypothetical protein
MEDFSGLKKKITKGIKNYFNKITAVKFGRVSKLILIITCLLLPLAILEKNEVWIFKYHFNLFSKDDYYWFYSTIAQALAALFGIGGMFTAYILQIVNNKIKESEFEAKTILEGWRHTEFANLSGEEFLKKLIDYNKAPKSNALKKHLRIEYSKLKSAERIIGSNRFIKKAIMIGVKNLGVFISSIILLSLIALLFSASLSRLFIGFIFGIFILLLILISVVKMISFIYATIST